MVAVAPDCAERPSFGPLASGQSDELVGVITALLAVGKPGQHSRQLFETVFSANLRHCDRGARPLDDEVPIGKSGNLRKVGDA